MPMLSMKTKKAMKPMLEMLAITDEAGLRSPNQPLPLTPSAHSDGDRRELERPHNPYPGTAVPGWHLKGFWGA
jgi:hypothetical protein